MDNYINLNKERRPSLIHANNRKVDLENMVNYMDHPAVSSKKKPKIVKKKKKNLFSWIKKCFCCYSSVNSQPVENP